MVVSRQEGREKLRGEHGSREYGASATMLMPSLVVSARQKYSYAGLRSQPPVFENDLDCLCIVYSSSTAAVLGTSQANCNVPFQPRLSFSLSRARRPHIFERGPIRTSRDSSYHEQCKIQNTPQSAVGSKRAKKDVAHSAHSR